MKRILLLIIVCVIAFGGVADAQEPNRTPTIYLYLEVENESLMDESDYPIEWLDDYLTQVENNLIQSDERPLVVSSQREILDTSFSVTVGDISDYPDVFVEPPYQALLIRVQLWSEFQTLYISPFIPYPYDPLPNGEFGWPALIHINDNKVPTYTVDMAVGTAQYIAGSCETAVENFESIRETADYHDTDLFTYSAPRFYEANCRYTLGEVEAAAQLLEDILAYEESEAETLQDALWYTDLPAMNLAAIYIEMGRSDEALTLLDTYRDISLENRGVSERDFHRYFSRSDLYLALDEPELAIAEFDELLGILEEDNTLNPLVIFAWIYTERGYRYQQIGDTEAALADYEHAIELDPDYPVAYYRRALLESGDEAQGDLQLFLELAPDFHFLHHPSLDSMIEDAQSRLV